MSGCPCEPNGLDGLTCPDPTTGEPLCCKSAISSLTPSSPGQPERCELPALPMGANERMLEGGVLYRSSCNHENPMFSADQMHAFRAEGIAAALAARQAPAELNQDAERYRWLRDKSEPGICAFYLSVGKAFDGVKFKQTTVDEAIDAQIAQEKAK